MYNGVIIFILNKWTLFYFSISIFSKVTIHRYNLHDNNSGCPSFCRVGRRSWDDVRHQARSYSSGESTDSGNTLSVSIKTQVHIGVDSAMY